MSIMTRTQARAAIRPVRPALLTVIAVLELAAAAWDGHCFLKISSFFSTGWGGALTPMILMPAIMAIAAIYAGVGLLQMHREAWTVWMVRHLVLGGIYIVSLPMLASTSAYYPFAEKLLYWRVAVLAFSVVAGVALIGLRSQLDNQTAR